ncbi:hypothetical protein D0871_23430 [Vibrio parahaemolyticus]|uniref:hypothetical protein n=1 Tax=Vibrio parahaemolyticus TaxID=670 RepID=UPI000EFA9A0D|nr:hypothetical protein [Vibrio parahaemolyticus]AYO07231.1 hypothetical protein D0871_23430 [Vibrio parahaemolyticus]
MKEFLKALNETASIINELPERIAPFGLQCVKDNYRNGDFAPNSTLTKNTKNGGAKPLFDSGETYASLTYKTGQGEYRIGTNKVHAPLINDGGIVKPLKAQKLTIPADKRIKKRTEAYGVRKTLSGLEAQGWKIFWRPNSVMGRAPVGAKGIGRKIKSRFNRNNKSKDKGVFYVLYIRADEVKAPGRPFMYLSDEQQKEQAELVQKELMKAIK